MKRAFPRTPLAALGAGSCALHVVALAALLSGAGCDMGIQGFSVNTDASSGPHDLAGAVAPSGLPCTIAKVLKDKCLSCHGAPLTGGAPMPLITRAQLTAASSLDPRNDEAHRSLLRMQAGTMPPGGGATAADIAAFQVWIETGEPAGDCAAPDAGFTPTPDMSGPPADLTGVANGLPCDVSKVFETHCFGCHGDPPTQNAPQALTTLAQLLAASQVDPRMDYAQRSVTRMQAGTMPPGGGVSPAEIAVVQAWIQSGTPAGSCAPPDGGWMIDAGPQPDLARPPVDGGPPGNGLPCDVAQLLQDKCASCHGNPPSQKAPMSLLTLADLTAPSAMDPRVDNARRSLIRMQAQTMPSGGGNTPAEIAILSDWINGGEIPGNCGAPGTDGGVMLDPLNAAPTCTSGVNATTRDSSLMRSGEACITCHSQRNGPSYWVAGTLYPTGHEPDDCSGFPGNNNVNGATVVVTDAAKKVFTLTVNSAGNFYLGKRQNNQNVAFQTPYTAKVVYMGKTRPMAAAQTSGDCNSCHSQKGSQMAPGRVVLPP